MGVRIGLVGLGTMGSALALNIAEKGFDIAVYNRTASVTDAFMSSAGPLAKRLTAAATPEALVAELTPPRAILIMVNAGAPVDAVIYHTIEIRHASFATPIRVVRDLEKMLRRVLGSDVTMATSLEDELPRVRAALAPLASKRPCRTLTVVCYPDGGIVDDCIVYRRGPERVLIVVNAANRDKDVAWFHQNTPEGDGVTIHDLSDETGLIAVQGPKAAALLGLLGAPAEVTGLRSFTFAPARLAGLEVLVARTGYTGEDGCLRRRQDADALHHHGDGRHLGARRLRAVPLCPPLLLGRRGEHGGHRAAHGLRGPSMEGGGDTNPDDRRARGDELDRGDVRDARSDEERAFARALTLDWISRDGRFDRYLPAPGRYTVRVTDANGCTVSTSATLQQPATAVTVAVSQTQTACYGQSNGAALATLAGFLTTMSVLMLYLFRGRGGL